MDFWLLVGRLLRRWYLTIPLAVAAVAISVGVSDHVRTSFSTETQVLLVPGGGTTGGANPLLLSNRNQLDTATQSVLFLLNAPDAVAVRHAKQPGADVRFTLVEEAPIIRISASAATAQVVHDATQLAQDQLDQDLTNLQRPLGTAATSRIDTVPLAEPTIVEEHGDQRRVLIGALVASVLLVCLIVLAADQLLRRRLEHKLTADLDRGLGRLTGTPQHRSG